MKALPRIMSTLAALLAGCAGLAGSTALAQEAWPTKPIRLIVPFTTGGLQDIAARTVSARMAEPLGTSFVVENRPGAGGNIAAAAAAKSAPDGYTLYWGFLGTNAANISLYKELPFDPARDFQPISMVGNAPTVLVVHPAVPAKNVAELIEYARANPGKLNFAHSGGGSPSDIFTAVLANQARIRVERIGYKGTVPAQVDLIGGRVQALFDAQVSGLEHVRAGRLRAIGIGGAHPLPAFPGVAPIAQTLPGFAAVSWFGLLGPAGLARDRVERLNQAVRKAMADESTKSYFASNGLEIEVSTPEEFRAFMAAETQRLGAVIKAIGMRAE